MTPEILIRRVLVGALVAGLFLVGAGAGAGAWAAVSLGLGLLVGVPTVWLVVR